MVSKVDTIVSMLTHGFHKDTTFPQMEMTSFPLWDTARWKQHHFYIISMGGNNVVSRWKPHGFHVLSQLWLEICLEIRNIVAFLLFPCHFHGFHMDTMWFQMWTPCGFKCGQHIISAWTPCGVQETIWKPTQKQLCMKPTGFIVNFLFVANISNNYSPGGEHSFLSCSIMQISENVKYSYKIIEVN